MLISSVEKILKIVEVLTTKVATTVIVGSMATYMIIENPLTAPIGSDSVIRNAIEFPTPRRILQKRISASYTGISKNQTPNAAFVESPIILNEYAYEIPQHNSNLPDKTSPSFSKATVINVPVLTPQMAINSNGVKNHNESSSREINPVAQTPLGAAMLPIKVSKVEKKLTAVLRINSAVNRSNIASSPPVVETPGVPDGLTASAGNEIVSLTWYASTDSKTTYNILRSTISGSGHTLIASGITRASYVDNTVKNGTTYYYVISSTNAAGMSSNSSEFATTPLLNPDITSIAINAPGSLLLTFTASTGATSYNIKYGTNPGTYSTTLTNVTSPAIVSGLTVGTLYYFQVNAINANASVNSAEAIGTPIATPSISSITANSASSLTVSFTAIAGATSYNLKYGTSTNSYNTTLSNVTSPITISSLVAGTSYYFKITAINSAGSMDSIESSATPLANFSISSTSVTSEGQITLAWNASLGADAYTVKYGTVSGAYNNTFSTSATPPTTVTGLNAGTTYYFMISATNANGSINANVESSLAPIAIPSTPTDVLTNGSNGSVGLSWTASTGDGTITYNILRSTTSGPGFTTIASGVDTTGYTDNSVANGTAYYYKISATNIAGTSPGSGEATSLPMFPPTAPSSLTATTGTANTQLNWNVSSGLGTINYSILRSVSSGSGFSTLDTNISTTNYTDLTSLNGVTYYYKVIATNAGGSSLDSNEIISTPLSLPTISAISVNGSGRLSIAFTASTGASSYNIKYGTSSNTYTTTISNASSPATISGLTTGATYYFRVAAINDSGSVDSGESFATPLGSFNILSATAIGNQIFLSWDTSTEVTSYIVKYGTASGVYDTTFSTSATSPTAVTGLSANTNYYFMVVAQNASGALNATSEFMGTTANPSTVPTSLSASITVASTIHLNWNASAGTTGITYKVYRSTTSGTGQSAIPVCSDISVTSCDDSTATVGTTYYYTVTSSNIAGESAKSSEVSATSIASFTLSNIYQSGLTQATLSWNSSTGNTLYTIKYGTSSGNYTTTAGTSVSTSFDISSLSSGTTYYFMVYSGNAAGSISASSELSLAITSNPSFSLNLLSTLIPTIGNSVATFSRTAPASMIDFEGFIRTSKANEARFSGARRVENIISPSVYNGSSRWFTQASGNLTQNSTAAPDGTTTATLVDVTTNNNSKVGFDANGFYNTKTNTGYIFSAYVKSFAGTGSWDFKYKDGDANSVTVSVNIDTTWRRFSFYVSPQTGTSSLVFYLGVNGESINKAYIWGAQIEEVPQGQAVMVASEYVSCGILSAPYHGAGVDCVKNYSTTNANTVDGSNELAETAGTSISSNIIAGYLSESSSTNLALYSERFDQSVYIKTNSTITANAAIAPNGATTGDKLREDNSNSTHEIYQSFSATSGQIYTASIYAKSSERRYLKVNFYNSVFQNSEAAVIDLQTGTLLNSPANVTIKITAARNNWYRIAANAIATATNTGRIYYTLASDSSGTNVYNGNGSNGIYVWGLQVENNYFASSYIPTTSAAVARDDDYLTYPTTGILNTLNDYTISGEAKLNAVSNSTSNWQCLLSSTSDWQPLMRLGLGPATNPITFSSNIDFSNSYVTGNDDDEKLAFHKYSARKTSSALDAFYDGTSGVSAAIGTQATNPTSILIGNKQSSSKQGMNGNIKSIKFWQFPLSNSDIGAL